MPSSRKSDLFEDIANVFGIVAAFAAVAYLLKSLADQSNTKIISNNARKVIDNKDEALKLRKAIDTYHVTGDWKKTEINQIL